MKTVAFYSYRCRNDKAKIAVNCAKHLSEMGKKVFVLCCDLFSPSLRYFASQKFSLSDKPSKGFLDYLLIYQAIGQSPEFLKNYVTQTTDSGVHFMLESEISSGYTSKILAVDWRYFFPEKQPILGVYFLLNLRNRIKDDFNPDIILIDMPAGITYIGTAILAVWAKKIIFLTTNERCDQNGFNIISRYVNGDHAKVIVNNQNQVFQALNMLISD